MELYPQNRPQTMNEWLSLLQAVEPTPQSRTMEKKNSVNLTPGAKTIEKKKVLSESYEQEMIGVMMDQIGCFLMGEIKVLMVSLLSLIKGKTA